MNIRYNIVVVTAEDNLSCQGKNYFTMLTCLLRNLFDLKSLFQTFKFSV
jgi:hypothetical protein